MDAAHYDQPAFLTIGLVGLTYNVEFLTDCLLYDFLVNNLRHLSIKQNNISLLKVHF